MSTKAERQKVLFELRNKRNAARKQNKDEVMAETLGEKIGKLGDGRGAFGHSC